MGETLCATILLFVSLLKDTHITCLVWFLVVKTMWGSYASVFTLLITLDAVLGQNNETGQEQNDYVTVGGRAFMSGNFSGNISVSDAVVNDSYIVGSSGNLVEFNSASARDNRTIKLLKDFRPSPPINYEFNKFPVRPVYPEAKTFSTRIPSEGLVRTSLGKHTIKQNWLQIKGDSQKTIRTLIE